MGVFRPFRARRLGLVLALAAGVAVAATAVAGAAPAWATPDVAVPTAEELAEAGDQMAAATTAMIAGQADYIRVSKSERRMTLFRHGVPLRTYDIRLGKNPVGHKQREGDNRTPEGIYYIEGRKPDSAFHRSLKISYPRPQDEAAARAMGVRPGGQIMIHGLAEENEKTLRIHRFVDWTNGCIAVTNREIEEIWTLVPDGIPIEIRP